MKRYHTNTVHRKHINSVPLNKLVKLLFLRDTIWIEIMKQNNRLEYQIPAKCYFRSVIWINVCRLEYIWMWFKMHHSNPSSVAQVSTFFTAIDNVVFLFSILFFHSSKYYGLITKLCLTIRLGFSIKMTLFLLFCDKLVSCCKLICISSKVNHTKYVVSN